MDTERPGVEKERQASTLAVLVLVGGAWESGSDVYFVDGGTLFELICTSFDL